MNKYMIILFAALLIISLAGCSENSEADSLNEEKAEAEPGAAGEAETAEEAVENAKETGQDKTAAAETDADWDTNTEQNQRGNSIGNLTGWGLAARQGDWIYYFVEQGDTENNAAFYKIRPDGSSRTMITEIIPEYDRDIYASSINVVGDWLYYEDISVMKLNLETGKLENLAHEWAEGLTVVGDWAYYVSVTYDGAIVKIQTDGSNHTIVSDRPTQHIVVTDNYIYYENSSIIYRIDHDGNNNTRIGGGQTWMFTISEEWIYYINRDDDNKIYRIDLEGNQRSQISESGAYVLNAYKDWVFFTNSDDEAKLYKVPLEGGEEIQLSDFSTNGITIFDDWLYLYDSEAYEEGLLKMKIDGSSLQKVHQ